MVGDPKALAQDPRDLVEFVSWILDVERGEKIEKMGKFVCQNSQNI